MMINTVLSGNRFMALLIATCGMILILSGCTGLSQIQSVNYNSRVSIIVIHFTSGNYQGSLNALTQASCRPVSSHYLIAEPLDASYGKPEASTYQLVAESDRAWHAGVSSWAGKTGLNDQSIGIELVNQGYCHTMGSNAYLQRNKTPVYKNPENGFDPDNCPKPVPAPVTDAPEEKPEKLCFYPDFDEGQLELLVELLAEILARHPEIKPTHIIGHSDIAPDRKVDPGPRFPWQRLARLGYGAWYDDATMIRYWERFVREPLDVATVQKALAAYGYGITPTGELDEPTRNVLRAFQMHFWPHEVTMDITPASNAALFALIEKYYPERLTELLPADTTPTPQDDG